MTNAQQASSFENTAPQGFETNATILRQWVLDNRPDLSALVECEIEFYHRLGETEVEHRSWGLALAKQGRVTLLDASRSGQDGEWLALLTRADGSKDLVKVDAPLG